MLRILNNTLICVISSGQSAIADCNQDSNPFAKFRIACVTEPYQNKKLLNMQIFKINLIRIISYVTYLVSVVIH